MAKNRKSPATKKRGQAKSNQAPPTSNGKAGFQPTITDETAEGEITVIVGGVQPPKKTKAAFEPTVFDETVPGECIGIIGVSRPPNKPTRPKG
jgi:hypothetical protein